MISYQIPLPLDYRQVVSLACPYGLCAARRLDVMVFLQVNFGLYKLKEIHETSKKIK
jgi:hypothetical protein